MTTTDRADLVSLSKAAEIRGIPRDTLYGWCRRGRVAGVFVVGGRIFIRRDEVEQLGPTPFEFDGTSKPLTATLKAHRFQTEPLTAA